MKDEATDVGSVKEVLEMRTQETYDAFGNRVDDELTPADCHLMFEFSGRLGGTDIELCVPRALPALPVFIAARIVCLAGGVTIAATA